MALNVVFSVRSTVVPPFLPRFKSRNQLSRLG